jgi:hypothetical protein
MNFDQYLLQLKEAGMNMQKLDREARKKQSELSYLEDKISYSTKLNYGELPYIPEERLSLINQLELDIKYIRPLNAGSASEFESFPGRFDVRIRLMPTDRPEYSYNERRSYMEIDPANVDIGFDLASDATPRVRFRHVLSALQIIACDNFELLSKQRNLPRPERYIHDSRLEKLSDEHLHIYPLLDTGGMAEHASIEFTDDCHCGSNLWPIERKLKHINDALTVFFDLQGYPIIKKDISPEFDQSLKELQRLEKKWSKEYKQALKKFKQLNTLKLKYSDLDDLIKFYDALSWIDFSIQETLKAEEPLVFDKFLYQFKRLPKNLSGRLKYIGLYAERMDHFAKEDEPVKVLKRMGLIYRELKILSTGAFSKSFAGKERYYWKKYEQEEKLGR